MPVVHFGDLMSVELAQTRGVVKRHLIAANAAQDEYRVCALNHALECLDQAMIYDDRSHTYHCTVDFDAERSLVTTVNTMLANFRAGHDRAYVYGPLDADSALIHWKETIANEH